jgi:hypothetical protein
MPSVVTAQPRTPRQDECAQPNRPVLLDTGCRVLDDFLEAFNARDVARWATTLNYPHVRFSAGEVLIWNSAAKFIEENDIGRLARSGWGHSTWDWRMLVQSSGNKLHYLVQFTRYDEADKPIASYESLYIITLRDGHWGVQARSSYAGISVSKPADK